MTRVLPDRARAAVLWDGRRLGKQFSALAVARLVAMAIQAVAIVLLARQTSVADFGLTITVIALQVALVDIASLGITPYILREHARSNFDNVRAALRLNTSSAVGGGLIAGMFSLLLLGDNALFIGVIVLLAFSVSADKNIEARLGVSIARGSSAVAVSSVLLRPIIALGLLLAVIPLGLDPILAFAVGKAVAGAVGLAHTLLIAPVPRVDARVSQRQLIMELWPLAGNNSLIALRSLDSAIVTAVSGTAISGLYAAAAKTLSPFGVVASSLSWVLMPTSAVMPGARAGNVIRVIVRITVVLTLAAIPLSLLSETAMALLFGEEFAAGAGAFAWILISIPASAAASLVSTVLQAQGRERYVLRNSALFVPLTLIAVALGALSFGATGAGIAFAVSSWLSAAHLLYGARGLH